MSKSAEKSEPSLAGLSLVEKDLAVSWDTVGAEYSWYRVETFCTPVDCESTGVSSDRCPSMTVVSTVVAQNLAELCESLVSPKVNAPMNSKILSVQRYSRSYIKENNQPDQCNVLEEVEFCQIPECQEFCTDLAAGVLDDREFRTLSRSNLIRSDRHFWNRRVSRRRAIKSELRTPSRASAVVSATSTDGDDLGYDASGVVEMAGQAYLVSNYWSFDGSGFVSVSGSFFESFSYDPEGSVHLSGFADDVYAEYNYEASGQVSPHGSAGHMSPSYFHFPAGGVEVYGAADTPVLDMGVFSAGGSFGSSAFGLGYEYVEDTTSSPLSISDFTVSACGCQTIGPVLLLRHNLARSEMFANFVSSGGVYFPDQMPMRYRAEDSSWRFAQPMSSKGLDWVVSASFECLSDVWRMDFGVRGSDKNTRIVVEIPSDLICYANMRSVSMSFYFSPFVSEVGSGVRLPAITPIRSKSFEVYGKVDSFVDGIFVPETLYYDGLGLFADSYWSYAPLQLDINPPYKGATSSVNLNSII